MPQLSDLVQKRKFVKKEYRPWDLSGSGTVDNKEADKNPTNFETSQIEKTQMIEKVANIEDIPATTELSDNKTDNDLDNNLSNKQVTIRKQLENNKITKSNKLDNKQVSIRKQTDNLIDNNSGNTDELVYLIESVKKLAGIQKNIFYYVISICSARCLLDTGNLLTSDLAIAVNCSIGSAKTSLIRLIEKQLIFRLQGKPSRGGHIVLGVTKQIQAAAIQAQQNLFNPLKISQKGNVIDNKSDNTVHYSSSNYKNITTTTTSLPDDWKKINFEILQPIGFSETQLRQLCDSNMTTPEIVQDAIQRFAYSLEHSDKVKAYNDPLNVLMGVLRKGQRWIEPNYISPKELTLRQLVEEKRKQKEQRDAMMKELIELEFPDWRRKLTTDEIEKIVPEDIRKTNLSAAIQASLRTYYVEKILLPRLEKA
ncbi:MAG: hypothetical protein JO149_08750 [Gammaproteobacteria bacterium]|nr:hypothetical protein [Gammaproteobacteria bacterium]